MPVVRAIVTPKRGRSAGVSKYPWAEWFDESDKLRREGQALTFEQGMDFPSATVLSFRAQALSAAQEANIRLTTVVIDNCTLQLIVDKDLPAHRRTGKRSKGGPVTVSHDESIMHDDDA